MLDIIFFIVLLYFMWRGYKRGFARELPRFASLAVALIFGIIFYSVIAVMLNSTPLPDALGSLTNDTFIERVEGGGVVGKVEDSAVEKAEETETEAEAEETTDEIDDETAVENSTTENADSEANESDATSETEENADDEATEEEKPADADEKKDKESVPEMMMASEEDEITVNQIFGGINSVKDKKGMIGEFIVMYLSLILLVIATYIVVRYFTKKKKLYRKIKIPMQINPALGGVVAVLRGILVVYIVVAFLVVCEPLMPNDFVLEQLKSSEIIRAMYDKNYIANIVARQDFLSGGI